MEQAVEDGGGDDRVAEHLTPLGEALVRGQDHAATFVAGRDQGEEGGGRRAIVRPDAELVDDQHLGGKVDAETAIEAVLSLGSAEVFHQIVGAGEVDAVAVLDRLEAERDGEVSLADAGWAEQQDVGGIGHERHGRKLTDLALVDRGLEGEVELGQGPLEGQMGESGAGGEVAGAAGGSLSPEEVGEQVGVRGLLLGGGFQAAVQDGGGLSETQLFEILTGLFERDHRTTPKPLVRPVVAPTSSS